MEQHTLRWMVVATLAVLASLCGRAMAQGGREDVMMFVNPVTSRSLTQAKVTLGLDADQQALARDLLKGYRASCKTMIDQMTEERRKLMEEAQKNQDWEAVRVSTMEQAKRMIVGIQKATDNFEADLKAMLTPEQAERFPAFERARRRDGLRPLQMMAGEGVDLIDVLDQKAKGWRERPEVRGVADEYETAFDASIRERQAMFRSLVDKVFSGKGDDAMQKEMMEALPKVMQRGKTGRDINRQFTRRLATALGEAERAAFEGEVLVRSYPGIYKESGTSKHLAAALGMKDLAEDARARVVELDASYRRELANANAALAKAIDEGQEKLVQNATDYMFGDRRGELEELIAEPKQRREKLDREYREKLEKTLSEEQRSRLPKVEGGGLSIRVEPRPDRDAAKEWLGEAEEE